jgi:hypothetical protein
VLEGHLGKFARRRDVLDFSLEKLDILSASLLQVLARQSEHLVGHIKAVGLAG